MSRGGRSSSDYCRMDVKLASLEFDSEFDFEVENAKFDKDQIEKEIKEKMSLSWYFTSLHIFN